MTHQTLPDSQSTAEATPRPTKANRHDALLEGMGQPSAINAVAPPAANDESDERQISPKRWRELAAKHATPPKRKRGGADTSANAKEGAVNGAAADAETPRRTFQEPSDRKEPPRTDEVFLAEVLEAQRKRKDALARAEGPEAYAEWLAQERGRIAKLPPALW